jgi:hypothetical protein
LPFWILFNIAVLVQLPHGSFPWLWVLCGCLMGILVIINLWLLLYYVWKRYEVRIALEASAFSGDLEQFGDFSKEGLISAPKGRSSGSSTIMCFVRPIPRSKPSILRFPAPKSSKRLRWM